LKLANIFQSPNAYLIAIFAVCIVFVAFMPSMGVDFSLLYPAGRAVWDLQNPYIAAPHFYNPPWMLVILAPLFILPIQVARWLWMAIGIVGYLVAFRRMNFDGFTIVAFFLTPFIYFDIGMGNCEWLVLLGTTMPIAWGAWVVILKPQASFVLLGLWIKQRHWSALFPLLALGALYLFGLWGLPERSTMPWSADIFPYGVPVGLVLAYLAFKRDDWYLALAAAPFLSPYLALQSWIFALLPLTRNRYALAAGAAVSWIGALLFLG
jgi:hypothetical protein